MYKRKINSSGQIRLSEKIIPTKEVIIWAVDQGRLCMKPLKDECPENAKIAHFRTDRKMTIPKPLREKSGIRAKDTVQVVLKVNGDVELIKLE